MRLTCDYRLHREALSLYVALFHTAMRSNGTLIFVAGISCLIALLSLFDRSDVWHAIQGFLISGVSSALAGALSHPIDLIKTRQMVKKTDGLDMGVQRVISLIYQENGVNGFLRGLSTTVWRQFIYNGLRISMYDGLRDWMPVAMRPVVTGIVGACVVCPIEVALVRLQAGTASGGTLKVIVEVGQREGLRSLWSGFSPLCVRAVLTTFGQSTCNDFFKHIFRSLIGMQEGFFLYLVSSSLAGLCAAAIVNPVEVIKTRQQAKKTRYRHAIDCLCSIVAEEGVWVLSQGLMANCCRRVPGIAMLFVTKEYITKWLI